MRRNKRPYVRKKPPNPVSLANLAPQIQPGQVLNPQGINRKRPYADRQYELSERILPKTIRDKINLAYEKQYGEKEMLKAGATFADGFLLRQALEALVKPAVQITAEWQDRLEGRAPQRIDVTGMERQEITIVVVEEKSEKKVRPIEVEIVQTVEASPNGNQKK